MSKGFIYALSNTSFPGVLKVGYSATDPSLRADKLYTTGVPTPYKLCYFCFIEDAHLIERNVHRMLSNLRDNKKREFFKIDIGSLKKLISSIESPIFEHESSEFKGPEIDHEIIIDSRHGVMKEEEEMEAFLVLAKKRGLSPFVQKLFYDSNSCCCEFTFSGEIYPSDGIALEIFEIAKATIGQFLWFDSVYHGDFISNLAPD